MCDAYMIYLTTTHMERGCTYGYGIIDEVGKGVYIRARASLWLGEDARNLDRLADSLQSAQVYSVWQKFAAVCMYRGMR